MILFKLQEEFQNRIYLMGFTVKKTSASWIWCIITGNCCSNFLDIEY
jgi:hypothetical protein